MKPGLISLLLLVAVCGWGCSGAHKRVEDGPQRAVEVSSPHPPAQGETAVAAGVYHEVLPGQTLWRISRVYGVSVEVLVDANRLDDPSVLSSGDRLLVPGARVTLDVPTAAPPTAAPLQHGSWVWPVEGGEVLSAFGSPRRSYRHQGLDIRGDRSQPVLAVRAGRVVYTGEMRGYGKTVILDHGEGVRSLYAHGSALLVHPDQEVRGGQPIARVGRTGNASTEHCHLEIHRNEVAVDPLLYLDPGTPQ
jgi:murein DD-endopeptidase MepM/ murein hydrolase activator NlpD